MIPEHLKAEAAAFDSRIMERVKNGLVPDIRKAASIDWFYNNPWRRRMYIQMVFGDYFNFASKHLPPAPSTVLEIGSGLGHMCLELCRSGYSATGIELSSQSVEIARNYFEGLSPADKGTGSVNYVNDDFMSWEPKEKFDAVCFFLTLHHFEEPAVVIRRVKSLLKPAGRLIVVEPARDLFSKRDAAVATLIRVLLANSGRWYEPIEMPSTTKDLDRLVVDIMNEYTEAKEKNEKEQSPQDNSTYSTDMLSAIRSYFDEIDLSYGNTLTPRMLGGIRGESEAEITRIAKFLKIFDDFATQEKLLDPGVFYFAGTLK